MIVYSIIFFIRVSSNINFFIFICFYYFKNMFFFLWVVFKGWFKVIVFIIVFKLYKMFYGSKDFCFCDFFNFSYFIRVFNNNNVIFYLVVFLKWFNFFLNFRYFLYVIIRMFLLKGFLIIEIIL